MKNSWLLIAVIFVVVLLDQCLKFYIKLNYSIGDGFDILGLSWAKIHFIENKGMAFGLEFGGEMGKYVLSLFRIGMVIFLAYLLLPGIALGQTDLERYTYDPLTSTFVHDSTCNTPPCTALLKLRSIMHILLTNK